MNKRGSLIIKYSHCYYLENINLLIKHINEGRITITFPDAGREIVRIDELGKNPYSELYGVFKMIVKDCDEFRAPDTEGWFTKEELVTTLGIYDITIRYNQ